MKIDLHDMNQGLLEQAIASGIVEKTVIGTGKDGTLSCATVRPIRRRHIHS